MYVCVYAFINVCIYCVFTLQAKAPNQVCVCHADGVGVFHAIEGRFWMTFCPTITSLQFYFSCVFGRSVQRRRSWQFFWPFFIPVFLQCFCEVFRSIFYDIEHPMTGTTETEIFFQSKKGPHWAPFIVQAPASAPQVQVCALHFERGLDRVAGNPAYYGHPGRVPCHACDESAGEHLSHHQWALRARSIFSGRRGI